MPKIMRNGVEYGRYTMTKIMKNNVEYSGSGADSATLALPTPSEASGAIARFNTDLTENLLSAVAEFSASQASGTPTPSAPIPIVGVDKVNVTLCGKNLFNPNTAVSGYIATDGNIASASTTNKEKTGDYVEVKDTNKYLTLSLDYGTTQEGWGGFGWYDANKNFISRAATMQSSVTKLSISRKPPENAKYFRATLRTYGNTDIQVEITETTTATEYEPYNGTAVIINLGGTYYGGSVDCVTGKITLTHKKVVFDENLPLSDFGLEAITGYARISYVPIQSDGKANTEFVSNTLHFIQPNATKNVYDIWNTITVPRMFIALPDTITTKQEAIAWFEDNPTEVVYELATPLEVYASNTAEIPTIVGENQVYADSGNIAVKFLETVGHKI